LAKGRETKPLDASPFPVNPLEAGCRWRRARRNFRFSRYFSATGRLFHSQSPM